MSEEGQEGRNAYQRAALPDFRKYPNGHESRRATGRREGEPAVRIWLMAARPRTLPAAIAPVLVGTAAAVQSAGTTAAGGCLRRRPRSGSVFIQIGDEPRQRLLRRPTRSRHRGPAGPGPGHLGRPGHPAAGPDRDLGRLRRRGRLRHLPGGGRRAGDPPGRSRLDRCRRPLHRRARGPTATPGSGRSSSSSSSAWSPSTAAITCSSKGSTRCRSGSRSRSASSPPRSSSSTTFATSRPTGAPGKMTWRCGWAARNAVTLYRMLVLWGFVACRSPWSPAKRSCCR